MRCGNIGGMRYRKLRIAWSAGWATLALLLAALWVRSYLAYDQVVVHYPRGLEWFIAYSNKGLYTVSTYGLLDPFFNGRWQFLARTRWGTAVCLPYSLTMLVVCAVSITPWIHYRFSLRTLLIGATLVALMLGLAVYAATK
jgi:hypothetical protein